MNALSIADIAKHCGVSKATVSRVINNNPNGVGEATRKKVQQAIEELNYRPNVLARGVAVSRSHMIGVVVPDVSNFFYPAILRGIGDKLEERGYSLIVCNSDYDPAREAELLMSLVDRRVDGAILCSGYSNTQFLQAFRKYNIRLALLGRTFDQSVSDASITGDNALGNRLAMTYLINNGHRRIAYIEGKTEISGSRQRLAGYRQSLEESGIAFDAALLQSFDYSIEFGRQAIRNYIEAGIAFDAVVTGSDLIAIGAVSELLDRGISIPGEIEVIGFDNIELSKVFRPALSTVSKPHYEMAQFLAEQIVDIIEGRQSGMQHMVVKPTLCLRETTRQQNGL